MTLQPVHCISFSPDGSYLAACSIKSFKIFEVDSERQGAKVSIFIDLTSSIIMLKHIKLLLIRLVSIVKVNGSIQLEMINNVKYGICEHLYVHNVQNVVVQLIVVCFIQIKYFYCCFLKQTEIAMVDENGFVRIWNIVAGKFRVEMVDLK